MTQRFLNIVVALWVGSLLTICAVVAPSLFALLSDRHLAGVLAGHFFEVESWLGLTFGALSLVLVARGPAVSRNAANYGFILIAALAPMLNELGLRPFMEHARAVDDMKTFGMLHGVGAVLFAIACLGSLALLWRVTRPAE